MTAAAMPWSIARQELDDERQAQRIKRRRHLAAVTALAPLEEPVDELVARAHREHPDAMRRLLAAIPDDTPGRDHHAARICLATRRSTPC